MARRSHIGSLAVSLVMHAGLIGLAASVVYSVAAPRQAIPVALLPGGGGGAGGAAPEAAAAPAVPAPAAAPPQAERMVKKEAPVIAAKPKKVARAPEPPAVSAPKKPAETSEGSGVGEGGGIGSGSGPGSGSGSGGGSGSGEGDGIGAGRGSGSPVDLRLYCLSCPEPSYPRVARARGWQGATDVELTVLADGRVDEAMIARSSGFDVLDRAALEVARQSRFSPPPQTFEPPVRGKLAYRFQLSSH